MFVLFFFLFLFSSPCLLWRYVVATIGGMQASVFGTLLNWLPERLMDAITYRLAGFADLQQAGSAWAGKNGLNTRWRWRSFIMKNE
jgi:hypothetical protein